MAFSIESIFGRTPSRPSSVNKGGVAVESRPKSTLVGVNGSTELDNNTFVISSDAPVVFGMPLPDSEISLESRINTDEIPYLYPELEQEEILISETKISTLLDASGNSIEPDDKNRKAIAKRIFGSHRSKLIADDLDAEIENVRHMAIEEIGYLGSKFFLEGRETDFNLEYLQDLKYSEKRDALLGLFGDEGDINRYPRYLISYANGLNQVARLYFRQKFLALAFEKGYKEADLIKYFTRQVGTYKPREDSPFTRARKLLEIKPLDRFDELMSQGQRQFWTSLHNIKSGKLSTTPHEDSKIEAFYEWLNAPDKRAENVKAIAAYLMLSGQEEDNPNKGELVEIFAHINPNVMSSLLACIEKDLKYEIKEMIKDRFSFLGLNDAHREGKKSDVVSTETEKDQDDDVPKPAQKVQATTTLEFKLPISEIISLASDTTLGVITKVFEEECKAVTKMELDTIDIINRAVREEIERQNLENQAVLAESKAEESAKISSSWRRRGIGVGVTALVLLIGGGFGYYKHVQRLEHARRLQDAENEELKRKADLRAERINHLKSLIEPHLSVTKESLETTYANLEQEARNNLGKIIEDEYIKKNKVPNPTDVWLSMLTAYMAPFPSDEMLYKEIKYCLDYQKNSKDGKGPKGKIKPEVEIILRDYLNGKISREELGDKILTLETFQFSGIPDIVFGLELERVSATGMEIKHKPADFVPSEFTNRLRSLFDEKEWYSLYHLENQDLPAYSDLVGLGTLMHGARGSLFHIMEPKHPDSQDYADLKNKGSLRRIKIRAEQLVTRPKKRKAQAISEYLENVERLNQILGSLESTQYADLDNAEREIKALLSKIEDVNITLTACAKCIVRAEVIEQRVNDHYDSLF